MNSNCPSWIHSQKGVQRIQGANGTYITDYNNPNYVSEAVQAIQALARRYDNDPRVHAFQIGILGYWGEWHTAGFSRVGGGGYSISAEAENAVLNAYKTSFTKAKIQGRYPWREPLKSWGGIGFHNDYFVANNGHSDEFDNAISAGGQWVNGPIGGETPPRSDAERAAELQAMHTTPKGESMVTKGHYSTMNGGYRVPPGHAYYASSMKLHRMMGYNYQISSALFAVDQPSSQPLAVRLNVDNVGLAPIYYPWEVQFALLRSDGTPAVAFKSNFDLRTLREGRSAVLSAEMGANLASRGQYRLAVRIIQPEADRPAAALWKLDARNAYVEFANDLTVIPGLWNSSLGLEGGWSVLGKVEIR